MTMNTDDKFHPVNTLQRALDAGEPFYKSDVVGLMAAFLELRIDQTRQDENYNIAQRLIEELRAESKSLEAQLTQAQDELAHTLKKLEKSQKSWDEFEAFQELGGLSHA